MDSLRISDYTSAMLTTNDICQQLRDGEQELFPYLAAAKPRVEFQSAFDHARQCHVLHADCTLYLTASERIDKRELFVAKDGVAVNDIYNRHKLLALDRLQNHIAKQFASLPADEIAFRLALADNPEDGVTRQIFADWLSERGRQVEAYLQRQLTMG